MIWWTAGPLAGGTVGVLALVARWNPYLALGLAWISAIFAGLFAGSIALHIKPELRFSTREQVDGFGYLHQPADFVITITIISVLAAVVLLVLQLWR